MQKAAPSSAPYTNTRLSVYYQDVIAIVGGKRVCVGQFVGGVAALSDMASHVRSNKLYVKTIHPQPRKHYNRL